VKAHHLNSIIPASEFGERTRVTPLSSTRHREQAYRRLRVQGINAEWREDPWLANLCWRKRAELARGTGMPIVTRSSLMKNTGVRLW
jgi:hypothetical protein